MAMILWDGIPIFRQLIQFQRVSSPNDEFIQLTAAAFIQCTYWTSLRHDPTFNLPKMPLLGHILLFASRLTFIFASGVFSFVFYRYSDRFDLTLFRSSAVIVVLFSVFCFTRHLERIGNLLLTGFRAPKE